MFEVEVRPFASMKDLLILLRDNPEKIVCPLCNSPMDAFVYYRGFDFNVSGRLRCKCKNPDCRIEFVLESCFV